MSRKRDKRAAVVLALLLLGAFVLGRMSQSEKNIRPGAPPSATAEMVSGHAATTFHD